MLSYLVKTAETKRKEVEDMCGIVGAVSRREYSHNIGKYLYIGLQTLQHRGHESAGISVFNGSEVRTHKDMGTVNLVFRKDNEGKEPLAELQGFAGIGHTRYSTTGESAKCNVQPILFSFNGEQAALAHNGNITNSLVLKSMVLSRGGYEFEEKINSDTALVAALVATSNESTFGAAFRESLKYLKGAFSLVALHGGRVYAAKDEFGLRPLALARSDKFLFVASESCTLDTLKAEFVKELEPGFAYTLFSENMWTEQRWVPDSEPQYKSCAFEGIYLHRPDSVLRGGINVQTIRKNMGAVLAKEHELAGERIDVVMGVPDSGNASALGYSHSIRDVHPEALFDPGFIRPHQADRTFIEPIKEKRREFQNLKHNPIADVLKGKNVLIVDDSIVRGNTMPYIVSEARRCGAEKVFVLSASPVLKHPCYLGVDLPKEDEFIANQKSISEIREAIDADYLGYLSLPGLGEAYSMSGFSPDSFCYGCMDNKYPV